MLRVLAFVLRLVGNLGYYTGRLLINLYDLIIFPALWLEGIVAQGFYRSQAEHDIIEREIDNGQNVTMPILDPLAEEKEMVK